MADVTVVVDLVASKTKFTGEEEIDANIASAVFEAAHLGDEIIEIRSTYQSSQSSCESTFDGDYIPTHHCIPGSFGYGTFGKTGDTLNKVGRTIIYTNTIGSLELANKLQSIDCQYRRVGGKGVERVKFHGVASYLSLISNAIIAKAALPDAEVIVNRKTCVGMDKDIHEEAVKIMKAMLIKIVDE